MDAEDDPTCHFCTCGAELTRRRLNYLIEHPGQWFDCAGRASGCQLVQRFYLRKLEIVPYSLVRRFSRITVT